MRVLAVVLAVQVLLAGVFAILVATNTVPFVSDDASNSAAGPKPKVDRFDSGAAMELLEEQVDLGPRPAGSAPSRRLAERLRRELPGGRFQPVPGGLRNVIGTVPGNESGRRIVVGAHYDTKDIPGFVGAVDGASGTAVLTELARSIRPRELEPTVVFVLFDGEEAPRGRDADFERYGLRGSRVAARSLRNAEIMLLLDFVGEKGLRLPREQNSDADLWRRLRSAAKRVGVEEAFPDAASTAISDDHIPFLEQGVPSIDLIDFQFKCFHRACDDLSQVSERSLDITGEAVREFLAGL